MNLMLQFLYKSRGGNFDFISSAMEHAVSHSNDDFEGERLAIV